MSAVDFLRPAWWPALLLAPGVWLFLRWRLRMRARRLHLSVGVRLPVLSDEVGVRRRRMRPILFAAGLLMALVALLEPRFGYARGEATWQGVDIVLCLDVSRSMRATDLGPDRLGRAQACIDALSERAEADRLGLVLFAGEARIRSPLTTDRASLSRLAREAHPASVARGGTDLGAALDAALRVAEGAGGRPTSVVLLTDGEDFERRGLRQAKRAKARGIPVHCVGLGTALGSKIPLAADGGRGFVKDRNGQEVVSSLKPDSLRALTDAAGGGFAVATSANEPLVELYEDEILPSARIASSNAPSSRKESRYQWPLGLALLLWLTERALGDRRRS